MDRARSNHRTYRLFKASVVLLPKDGPESVWSYEQPLRQMTVIERLAFWTSRRHHRRA
jgi:uncharacterized protein (DUF427 family)